MKLGAIDVGSQSIRISIFEDENGVISRCHAEFEPIALGKKGFDNRVLGKESIDALVALFLHFKRLFNDHAVIAYGAVATSAMRNFSNRHEILTAIEEASGIELVLIGGEEEAELNYQGVLDVIGVSPHPRWLVDIGGGSVELIADTPEGRAGLWSLPIGSWRFPELCQKNAVVAPNLVIDDAVEAIEKAMVPCQEGGVPSGSEVVALGGNVRALGWLLEKRNGSAPEAPPMAPLKELLNEAVMLSTEERSAHYEISESRSETLVSTGVILYTLATRLGVSEVSTPHVNLRRCMAAFLSTFAHGSGRLHTHELHDKICRAWLVS